MRSKALAWVMEPLSGRSRKEGFTPLDVALFQPRKVPVEASFAAPFHLYLVVIRGSLVDEIVKVNRGEVGRNLPVGLWRFCVIEAVGKVIRHDVART